MKTKHTNQIKECKCHCHYENHPGDAMGNELCSVTSCIHCQPDPKGYFDLTDEEKIAVIDKANKASALCPEHMEYHGVCVSTDKPPENAVKLHPCASNTIVNQLSSEESVIVKSDTPKSKSGKDIDVPTKSEAQEAVTRAEEALRDNPKVYEDHLSKSEDVESREFYELMQLYRHAPLGEQKAVTGAYEAVKSYISSLLKDRERQSRDDALMEAGNIALEEEAYQAYHAIEELRTSISSKYKVKEGKE